MAGETPVGAFGSDDAQLKIPFHHLFFNLNSIADSQGDRYKGKIFPEAPNQFGKYVFSRYGTAAHMNFPLLQAKEMLHLQACSSFHTQKKGSMLIEKLSGLCGNDLPAKTIKQPGSHCVLEGGYTLAHRGLCQENGFCGL